MPRPKELDAPVNMGFRVPAELIRRLDTYRAQIEAAQGHLVSRSDAIRVLLDRALAAQGIPAEAPKAKRKR